MEILNNQDNRLVFGLFRHERRQHCEHFLPLLRGKHEWGIVRVGQSNVEERGKELHTLGRWETILRNKSLQFLLMRCNQLIILQGQKATERIDERIEGRILMVRRTPTLEGKRTIRHVRFYR